MRDRGEAGQPFQSRSSPSCWAPVCLVNKQMQGVRKVQETMQHEAEGGEDGIDLGAPEMQGKRDQGGPASERFLQYLFQARWRMHK